MNQVFQASPVRSDSYKAGIRALGLLCWLLISSWFPAYNFTFKARGLEAFPVGPAPTGSQRSAGLAKPQPQAVAGLKKRVRPHQQTGLPLRHADSTAQNKSGGKRRWLGFMLFKKSIWITSTWFQKQNASSSSINIYIIFFLDFYNIRYFCLAKELQNNTHSIIRKHLAKIPWETNHPKQARNLRALPLAGQRNVLKNRNFFNLSRVSCCPDYTDLKLIKMPHIPKTPYNRNWRFWWTFGPLLRKKALFQQRTNTSLRNNWINQCPAKEATLNIVTGLITRQNLFPLPSAR